MRRFAYCMLGLAAASTFSEWLRAAPAPSSPAATTPPATPPPPPGSSSDETTGTDAPEEPGPPPAETVPPPPQPERSSEAAASPPPARKSGRARPSAALGGGEAEDVGEVEEDEELPAVIPPAADMRGGHFVAALGAALVIPIGSVEEGSSIGDLGIGPGFVVDLGVGISRMTVLALSGQYASLGRDCANCDPFTWAAGAFLRYHLVQGLRFDPWMAAGVGVRGVHIDDARSYVAADWVRLQVGGDWYASSVLGFGPFAEFDFSTALKASEGDLQNTSLFVHTWLGLRVVLDVPGK